MCESDLGAVKILVMYLDHVGLGRTRSRERGCKPFRTRRRPGGGDVRGARRRASERERKPSAVAVYAFMADIIAHTIARYRSLYRTLGHRDQYGCDAPTKRSKNAPQMKHQHFLAHTTDNLQMDGPKEKKLL